MLKKNHKDSLILNPNEGCLRFVEIRKKKKYKKAGILPGTSISCSLCSNLAFAKVPALEAHQLLHLEILLSNKLSAEDWIQA